MSWFSYFIHKMYVSKNKVHRLSFGWHRYHCRGHILVFPHPDILFSLAQARSGKYCYRDKSHRSQASIRHRRLLLRPGCLRRHSGKKVFPGHYLKIYSTSLEETRKSPSIISNSSDKTHNIEDLTPHFSGNQQPCGKTTGYDLKVRG